MSNDHPDSLQVLFRKSFPVGFIDHLIRRQDWIYNEAYQQCHGSALWTEAEARSLLGDVERALFENEMRRAAEKFGLKWQDAEHVGNNCSYVRVAAANFRLTGHRVSTPGQFVRPCESRKQEAAVNRFMDGYVLDGALCVPLPRLEKADEIAIYALHGSTTDGNGNKTLFLQLAAPDSELDGYTWQCSFLDLKQAYLGDTRQLKQTTEIEDKAKPKPKQTRREEAQNE